MQATHHIQNLLGGDHTLGWDIRLLFRGLVRLAISVLYGDGPTIVAGEIIIKHLKINLKELWRNLFLEQVRIWL